MLQARRLLPDDFWLAVWRAIGDRVKPPTLAEEIEVAIMDTRRELLVAEGLEEEARHSVAMLRERLGRLEGSTLR